MQLFNLLPIIRRHTQPNAILRFYPPTGIPNLMTVCDFDYPRREGFIYAPTYTAYDRHVAWYHQSQVCNVGWFNGELLNGRYPDERLPEHRSAYGLVEELLENGCIVPGEELDRVFGIDSRTMAREWGWRYLYE